MALGAIMGALLAAGTSAAGMWTSRRNVDKTIRANKELAEYGYSKDLEMWNRGNEFNSPESQMKRLTDAGLNPNMIYGSGSSVGNTSGQLPKYNAPTVKYEYEPPDLLSVLSAYQDMNVKSAQADNIRAQTKATEENTALMGDRGLLIRTQQSHEATKAGTSAIEQEQLKRLQPYQLESVKQGTRMKELEIGQMPDRSALLKMQFAQGELDRVFKEYRNYFAKMGVTSSDHMLVRLIARMLQQSGFEY